MKKLPLLILIPVLLLSCGQKEKDTELTIYCYDSFSSEWGPGPIVTKAFTEKTGIQVNLVSAGDAGELLAKAILEKENPKGDLVLGIDNNLLSKALDAEILEAYVPEGLDSVPEELRFDPTNHLTPFDYGYFSIVYDSDVMPTPPASLEDLTKEEYREKLIIMDPRTSSVGLGLLLWVRAVYGDEAGAYWDRLKPNLLTVSDGWSGGYGLFTSGEAPMVLSYTTSPAYHLEFEETDRYKAAEFAEGHYLQIEGLGLLKGAAHPDAAKAFIDFALTDDFQSAIPLTNIMYPASKTTALPDSFAKAAVRPGSFFLTDSAVIAENRETWVSDWTERLSR